MIDAGKYKEEEYHLYLNASRNDSSKSSALTSDSLVVVLLLISIFQSSISHLSYKYIVLYFVVRLIGNIFARNYEQDFDNNLKYSTSIYRSIWVGWAIIFISSPFANYIYHLTLRVLNVE